MMKLFVQLCLSLSIIAFSSNTIAVKNVKSTVLEEQEKESLSNYISNELNKVAGTDKVMAWSDVAEMLTHLGQAEKVATLTSDSEELECLTDKCFAELGGALGIDRILVTDIGRFGSDLVVNMRIIDLARAESKLRSSKRVNGNLEKILDAVPELLLGLGYPSQEKINNDMSEEKRLEQKKKDEAALKGIQKANLKRAEGHGVMRQKAVQEENEKQKSADAVIAEVGEQKNEEDWVLRPWARYGGLVVAVIGVGIIGSNNEKIDEASSDSQVAVEVGDEIAFKDAYSNGESAEKAKNLGMGFLGLGAFSFIMSFAF